MTKFFPRYLLSLFLLLVAASSSLSVVIVSADQIKLVLYTEFDNCSGPSRSVASYTAGQCYNSSLSTSTVYTCNASDIWLRTYTTNSKCINETSSGHAPEQIHFSAKECMRRGKMSSGWTCVAGGGRVEVMMVVFSVAMLVMVLLLVGI